MINFYLTENNRTNTISEPVNGCWISMIAPNQKELIEVSEYSKVEIDVLKAALDIDESSRIDTDDNYTMVLVNIPTVEENDNNELYSTIPLSIIITKEVVITVCSEDTAILRPFAVGRIRDFNTSMKSRFILQMLYRIASTFLQFLRIIDKRSDEVEIKLHKSTENRELIELLKLQKSLVYFSTALRSNEVVLEKLFRNDLIKKYPDDSELLEDVIVENKQAIEMADIYTGILTGMMDAFASVISNNLNIVMKALAIITIAMSIPNIIFGAYGMNVNARSMPFSSSPWSFALIIVLSTALSVLVAIIFSKAKTFK